jgi:Putative zinc-finger
MNCEKCQGLLSEFLDGTLTGEERTLLGRHLDDCPICMSVRDDLSAIVTTAQEVRDCTLAPANSRALWLRISNTIEAERETERRTVAQVAAVVASRRENLITRVLNKRWTLSLPQLTAAIAALVVGVAAFTALSVQSLRRTPPLEAQLPVANRTPASDPELELLMQRIEQRKTRWSPRMREAFEHNLSVIDAAVNDSREQLDQSPHDEVSEEALNDAMSHKKELLREFADL